MSHGRNALLARMSPDDLGKLGPHLESVELKHGLIIVDSGQRATLAYFPHSGVLSCVVEMPDGEGIETGMIGWDGSFGAVQALDDRTSVNKVMVQVPGSASMVETRYIKAIADKSPEFRGLLVRYEQFFLAQVQQTAACNALHTVEQRTCKWLLRMHELAGNDLPLTQEFLSQMMGVRRTSVTAVAIGLQNKGLISYRRGRVRIENLDGLRQQSCACADIVSGHYDDLFGKVPSNGKVSEKILNGRS
jgi:CRP-like cAMP-binding protein